MKKREYLIFGTDDWVNLRNAVGGLDLTKKWRVTIAPYVKNRTTDQNSLLWAWYTEISEHTGHTPEEIHEYCKVSFLTPRPIIIEGKNTKHALKYYTTTKLTTTEMTDYMDRIRAWAQTELGMTLSVYG